MHLFLKWVDPYLQKGQECLTILTDFMVKPELYKAIPDVMQQSYVESIGSKLKHHNPPHGNIAIEYLDEELIIAWNRPNISDCDKLVKTPSTLCMAGFSISLLEMGGALLPPMGGGGGTWCRWREHPAKWGERSILVHVCTWALVIFALLHGVFSRCQQKEVLI